MLNNKGQTWGDFIIQKYNLAIDKINPIVHLRGIVLVNTKDHCKDFLHSTNIDQT